MKAQSQDSHSRLAGVQYALVHGGPVYLVLAWVLLSVAGVLPQMPGSPLVWLAPPVFLMLVFLRQRLLRLLVSAPAKDNKAAPATVAVATLIQKRERGEWFFAILQSFYLFLFVPLAADAVIYWLVCVALYALCCANLSGRLRYWWNPGALVLVGTGLFALVFPADFSAPAASASSSACVLATLNLSGGCLALEASGVFLQLAGAYVLLFVLTQWRRAMPVVLALLLLAPVLWYLAPGAMVGPELAIVMFSALVLCAPGQPYRPLVMHLARLAVWLGSIVLTVAVLAGPQYLAAGWLAGLLLTEVLSAILALAGSLIRSHA